MEQTGFNERQEVLLPPPTPEQPVPSTPQPVAPKKTNKLLIVVAAVAIVFILLGLILVLTKQKGVSNIGTNIIPIPTKAPVKIDQEMYNRVLQLQKRILDANPNKVDIAPPQLDYQLQL
jgi:hypothetical protein